MAARKWTYGNDPANSDRDAVRWRVGDIVEKRPLADDREIDYALSEYPNVLMAASITARAIGARFAAEADVTVGQISKALGKVADNFRKLADDLKEEASLTAGVSFPATIVGDKEALEQDTTLTEPQISIGLGDNPWALQLNDDLPRPFRGFF